MFNIESILKPLATFLNIILCGIFLGLLITFPIWKKYIIPSKPIYFKQPLTLIYERNTIRDNDSGGYMDLIFQCHNVEGKLNGKYFGKNMKCERLY